MAQKQAERMLLKKITYKRHEQRYNQRSDNRLIFLLRKACFVRHNARQEGQKTCVILAFMKETYTLLGASTLSIEEQLTQAYQLTINLQRVNEALAEENKKLLEENRRLQEQLALSKQRQFGKKSEVGEDMAPESEALITIPAHTRRKKTLFRPLIKHAIKDCMQQK